MNVYYFAGGKIRQPYQDEPVAALRNDVMSEAYAVGARHDIQSAEKINLLTLSREDYGRYFTPRMGHIFGAHIKQAYYVPNCGAVAHLHALTTSTYFELMARSRMSRYPDGTWEVRLPLLGLGDADMITVYNRDLMPKKGPYPRAKSKPMTVTYRPVWGGEGYGVLDQVMLQRVYGVRERWELHKFEGPYLQNPFDLFLGSDNIQVRHFIRTERLGPDNTQSLDLVTGNDRYDHSHRGESIRSLHSILKPGFTVAVAYPLVTQDEKPIAVKTDKHSGDLVPNHGYSVQFIGWNGTEQALLYNAWDTSQPFAMPLDHFTRHFREAKTARVKVDESPLLRAVRNA